jgi:hypothetical protein
MRRFGLWLLLPAVLVPVAFLALTLSREDRPLLTSDDSWRVFGDFARVPTPDPSTLCTGREDATYIVATRTRGDGSGHLISKPFAAPKWISLTVNGDLTRPGNSVFFQLEESADRFPVRVQTEEYFWRRVTCGLPWGWVGKKIRLIADAGPGDPSTHFGLSNPRALGWGLVLLSQLRAVATLPAFAAALGLFLMPGLPLAGRLVRGGFVTGSLLVPTAVVSSCLLGYLTFWAYFLDPRLGYGVGGSVLVAGTAALASDLWRPGAMRSLLLSPATLIPIGLMGLVGAFYISLLCSVDLQEAISDQPRGRFLEFVLAIDNELPFLFANQLYEGKPPRGLIVGEWHYSDRPPLQAGLLLVLLPFGKWAGQADMWSILVACALQCAWVPALWALLEAAGLSRRRAALALLFITLSGFALVNTVFTWPKMLAAGLSLFAITLALCDRGEKGRPLPVFRAILLGLSAALASLSHGGIAFTLLPLGVLLLTPRWFPGLSRVLAAGAVYVATLLPWMFFQAYYDPPGDLLLRQHLANSYTTGPERTSLPQELARAYAALSAGEILTNKLGNVTTLFVPSPDQYPWISNAPLAEWFLSGTGFRRCDFLCLFWALGLLNLGWLVPFVPRWRQSPGPGPLLGFTLPALGVAGVLIWILLMFGPRSTVIHQGSYATFLLLFASLSAWLTTLRGRSPYILLGVQAAVFVAGWLLTSPANGYGLPNVFMIALAVLSFAALARLALGAASPQTQVPGQMRGQIAGRRKRTP